MSKICVKTDGGRSANHPNTHCSSDGGRTAAVILALPLGSFTQFRARMGVISRCYPADQLSAWFLIGLCNSLDETQKRPLADPRPPDRRTAGPPYRREDAAALVIGCAAETSFAAPTSISPPLGTASLCADCRAGSARGAPTPSAVAPVAGSEVPIAKLCGYEFAVPVAACRHGGVFVD